MASFYRQSYCIINIDPWNDHDGKLDRYFTSLTLHQEVEKSRQSNEQHKNEKRGAKSARNVPVKDGHNGIFKVQVDGEYPCRIVVHGGAGMGKSTLCKKLA